VTNALQDICEWYEELLPREMGKSIYNIAELASFIGDELKLYTLAGQGHSCILESQKSERQS
jgi:hypothetical protein